MNCCCKKPVIILSSGKKMCRLHFTEYFENKVFRTIRHFNLIGKQENLGVALSGGKDSLTLLYVINKLSKHNPKIKISAISINEGIENYRETTLKTAEEFCGKNNIPLKIYSYKEEFGMPLDTMLKVVGRHYSGKPCTICGIFRRYLLNKKSRELGFTKLATGHNLDDECQSILMNQFKNNIQASARLGPKTGIKDSRKFKIPNAIGNRGFVQRIKPLYLCTEKEAATYAFINNLLGNFAECPNASKSYRAKIRDILNELEQKFPGTKHGIINSFLRIMPDLRLRFKEQELNYCRECGEPASKDECNACKYVKMLYSTEITIQN